MFVRLAKVISLQSMKRILRIGFWVALVVVAGLVIRSIIVDDDSSGATASTRIVTVDDLREAARSQGRPIYWAGQRLGTELELSQPDESSTYVRYLTGGAEPEETRSDFLTVGTYDYPGATKALIGLSQKVGGVRRSAPGGGVVYFNRARPQSVYLAYPGVDVQIEVYDPDPGRAQGLVASGQVVPLG